MRDENWLSDKLRHYGELFKAMPPDVDWKDATLDLGDILSELLGGGELGHLIATDVDFHDWEDLRIAKRFRDRAGHPNSDMQGIPLVPSPVEWRSAAQVLFKACELIMARELKNLQSERIATPKAAEDYLQWEGSEEKASLFDGIQGIAAGLLLGVTVANLNSLRRRCVTEDQDTALSRIEACAHRLAAAEIGVDEFDSLLPDMLADCIRALPHIIRQTIISHISDFGSMVEKRRETMKEGTVLEWVQWGIEQETWKKYGNWKTSDLGRILGHRVPKPEFGCTKNLKGTATKGQPERDFCFVRGDDGVDYFMHFNVCAPDLLERLRAMERGARQRVEFRASPANEIGKNPRVTSAHMVVVGG